jgi:hypothetical protein
LDSSGGQNNSFRSMKPSSSEKPDRKLHSGTVRCMLSVGPEVDNENWCLNLVNVSTSGIVRRFAFWRTRLVGLRSKRTLAGSQILAELALESRRFLSSHSTSAGLMLDKVHLAPRVYDPLSRETVVRRRVDATSSSAPRRSASSCFVGGPRGRWRH